MILKTSKSIRRFLGWIIIPVVCLAFWQYASPNTSPLRYYGASLINQFAKEYNLEGITYKKISVGFGTIHIEDAHLPDKTLNRNSSTSGVTIDEITLHFTPLSIYRNQIELVELDGLSINAQIQEDKAIDFGQLSKILEKIIAPSKQSQHKRIKYIDINDSRLFLCTKEKSFEIPIDMSITNTKSSLMTLEIDWSIPNWHNVEAHTHAAILQDDIEAMTEINHLIIDDDDFLLEGKKALIKVNHSLSNHIIDLSINGVIQSFVAHNMGYLTTPINFEISAKGTIVDLDFNLECKNNKEDRLLKISGTTKPFDSRAFAKIDIPRVSLPDVMNVNPFLEKYLYPFKSIMGQIMAEGQLAIEGDWLNPKGLVNIQMDQIDVTSEDISIENGFINLHMISLNPFALHQEHTATIGKVVAHGVPVDTLKMRFSWPLNQPLMIRDISGKTMGGDFILHSIKKIGKSQDSGIEFSLKLNNISLQDILKISDISGLSGKGALSGEGTLQYNRDGLSLMKARIKSSSSNGVINYVPNDLPQMGKTSSHSPDGSHLAFQVLKELQFTLLDVKIKPPTPDDKKQQPETGKIQAEVKILGFNRNVMDGHPFEFNITTTGKLDQLVSNTLKNLLPSHNVEPIKEHNGK